MGKKLTTEEFIERATKIHGDKYDYSLVEYINNKSNVKIICPVHGIFEQRADLHKSGRGCPKCVGKNKTSIDFINDAKKIHGDKYDYSLSVYKNAHEKIKIICDKHGIFEQNYSNHINGYGCPKCSGRYKKNSINYNLIKKNKEKFIENAKRLHDNKYDYSLVVYKNTRTKIKIICQEHGIFEQTPNNHTSKKYGCPTCGNNHLKEKFKKTSVQFILDANNYHNYLYDYSLVDYKNAHEKIKIICEKHGVFNQTPNKHLNGQGCPICKNSRGELSIRKLLIDNNIIFKQEKIFNDCKDQTYLPFDFYLKDYNLCIEFDGKQHFEISDFFGGECGFKKRQKHDQIKNQYCKDNNIDLIRIRYDENINDKLGSIL